MRLISVTEALSPFTRFEGIPPAVLEAAKQRGNRLHAAAAAKLSGTWLVEPLLPEDSGYWHSLSTWIDAHIDKVIAVEPELKNERLGFVGHPDLICHAFGRPMVVDWKTPAAAHKTWRVQLSAYCHLAGLEYRKIYSSWNGMTVQPDRDGKPAKGTRYASTSQDWQIFVSALNCARYFISGGNQ